MKKTNRLEKLAVKTTSWIGTPVSIIVHTIFFVGIFMLVYLGVGLDRILLVFTTVLSVEAIYLAIFIQMTVNRSVKSLTEVEGDIDEIEKDIDEIQEDVEDIQEEHREDDVQEARNEAALKKIETGLQKLLSDIENLKRN